MLRRTWLRKPHIILGDGGSEKAIATAMLDCLLHHPHVYSLKRDSYRIEAPDENRGR